MSPSKGSKGPEYRQVEPVHPFRGTIRSLRPKNCENWQTGVAISNPWMRICDMKHLILVFLFALAPLSYGEVPDNFWADYLDM